MTLSNGRTVGPTGGLDCDAVIVGSGPSGSTVADLLTAHGWHVVVLEKGANHLIRLEAPFGPLGHSANDELKSLHRHLLGPDPLVEPRTFRRSEADGDHLFVGHVNSLPSTIGGGGFHADGKLPRFREDDFRLRSTLGPVDGADVVDWPLAYEDLEPYYAEAERLVGVAGEETNPFAAWRSGPFPMPPGPDMQGAILSMAAAERTGLHPYRCPTGVNSVPYDGRPACNNCGFCGGFGCPIEAKGDPVALLRRALRTGRCEIRPESYVVEITTAPDGRWATGVRYLDADRTEREVRAAHVVLAAGAFETPRLLLRQGLGNSSGLVGRNLMYHFQTLTVGAFPQRLESMKGRCVTGAHDDHIVGDAASAAAARDAGLPWMRGGLVEHGGASQPVREAQIYGPGTHHGAAMRDSSLNDRLWVFTMQGEDLAQPGNRIDLDPTVRDAFGFPAGRVTYAPHRHELATSAHVGPILEDVLRDAGAEWTITTTSPPTHGEGDVSPLGVAPASYHIMGTTRMGADPSTSVVGPEGRLWDVDNVLVVDSSVFPTSAGYNPTLTIMAMAARTTRLLLGEALPPTAPHP
ncbi:MAG: GMC family oxidoreductase [Acidimicrobiales bacterium]